MKKPLPAFPSKERLKEMIAFMREEAIHCLEFNGVFIELSDKQPSNQPQTEPQVDRLPEPTEEQRKQEEEANLFWSAG
jgi:hypothetical protein